MKSVKPQPKPTTLSFAAAGSNKIFSHIDIVHKSFYYLDNMVHLYYLWLSQLQLSPQGASECVTRGDLSGGRRRVSSSKVARSWQGS